MHTCVCVCIYVCMTGVEMPGFEPQGLQPIVLLPEVLSQLTNKWYGRMKDGYHTIPFDVYRCIHMR